MAKTDARPPPVCREVEQTLAQFSDSADIAELRIKHRVAFIALLGHAETCPSCKQLLEQSTPPLDEATAQALDEGLDRLGAAIHQRQAEHPAGCPPQKKASGT